MLIVHNGAIDKHIRLKFVLPTITLSVVFCFVILIFSTLILNRVQNNNMYIISEMLILLVVLTTFIFLTRYITKNLLNEVLDADETARKATEEKNMLENIEAIMNGLDIMIFVTDPKTNEILFMNEIMKQHYKVEGDPVGQICYKVLKRKETSFEQDKRCSFCPCFKIDKKSDETIIWDEHIIDSNCIYRRVDRYIKWANGKTVHIQHSVDMTELINAKKAAEMSNKSKGIFLAQMSHEIRTPMNAILGISEIQLLDKNISANAEEGYRKIYEAGNLLLNIINDILDFSKIDAGKLEIVCTQYNIPELINNTVQLNRLRFEHKPITIKINLDEKTPYKLIGDGLRIKQILNNLLSNAFKYTEKGKVEFSVYTEAGYNDKTVMLVFRVEDTGQGMTESQVSRIFDDYTRFNLETNRSIYGTGLGMSITKRLIDMMDGEIHVESKPGKGSVFTVRLPQILCGTYNESCRGETSGIAVCGKEIANDLREFNYRNISLQKKSQITYEHMPYGKVLIVDDVESNLLVAKGLLMPYGLHIELTNNGYEVIEKIKNNNVYDIIFMDHMMPGIDGLKTTKILRDLGYTNTIIALTANAVIGQEEVLLSNGFNGFISKPIDSQKLNHILIEFIQNKNLNNETEESFLAKQAVINTQQKQSDQKVIENNDLAFAVTIDLKNAITVLEDILPKTKIDGIYSEPQNSETSDTNSVAEERNFPRTELELFTTTVHGMKSALSNIGEKQLSNIALRLEQAGNNSETIVILKETPKFINTLKSLMDNINSTITSTASGKISYSETDNFSKLSNDEMIYLRNKLNEIRIACKKLNPKDAKKALTDLKQKKLPYITSDVINEISLNLLHSEFSKAIAAVDKMISVVN